MNPVHSSPPAVSRRLPHVAITSALMAMFAGGCSRESSREPAARAGRAEIPVLVAQAVEKDVPVRIGAIGNVRPFSRVTVRSQITGQLQTVHFKEGQEVHKGDLLFTIDPRPAQAALEQARANLARDEAHLVNARIALDRVKQLLESKYASQEDFDNARATLDALQGTVLADRAAITNGTLNLDYTTIHAPVDAVAGAQLVHAGNIVKSTDDELVILNQIQPVFVAFAVPEHHLPEIRRERRGQALKASAMFEGLQGPIPHGDVTFVDNAVDKTTGTIELKATFANTDRALWPGQLVQVELGLATVPRAVVVPTQAIQTGQDGEYVFVVKPDHTVDLRPVKSGVSFEGETAVSGEVKPGDTVVTDGQLNLVAGRTVAIKTPGAVSETKPARE